MQKTKSRERELEERLEEMEVELRELRRKKGSSVGGSISAKNKVMADQELLERNAQLEQREQELEENLEVMKGLLEENSIMIQDLREQLERKGSGNVSDVSRRRARVEELEAENEGLRMKIDEQTEALAEREDEREELLDEIQSLNLQLENLIRRREAENAERSESRAQMLEEREEREAIEGDLNALRDKLAAAAIEMSQKEDELEMKNREIQELVAEHERIVELVEAEWRGEVEEAQGRVEELQDVCFGYSLLGYTLYKMAKCNFLIIIDARRERCGQQRAPTQNLRSGIGYESITCEI